MPDDKEAKDTEKAEEAARPQTEEVPKPKAPAADEHVEADGEPSGEHPLGEDERGIFGRFTRKLRDRKELSEDAWKAVGAVLTTSDRAKSEFIRMLGREVRHYLDGLQLTDDLRELVTNHSLEVHASLHLKPLPKAKPAAEPRADEDEDEDA